MDIISREVKLGGMETRDIAERQRAEEALRESQTRYQRLFDMESDAIVLVENETGQVLEVNQAACSLYGYNRAEWLRMKHTDVSAEPTQTRQAALEGRKVVPIRWHRKRDGVVFPVEITASHFEWQGKMVHLAAIRDITERIEAEETLHRSEAWFRCLANVLQFRGQSTQDFLDFALHQAIELTGSKVGQIYFYHDDRKDFVLNTWSREARKESAVANPKTCRETDNPDLWGEAVRQRRPIVVNDFQADHPLKQGHPEAYAPFHRYLAIPVFSGERIVAVATVANKERAYDETDIEQLTVVMDAVWRVVEQRDAMGRLAASEERFRTLVERDPEVIFIQVDDRFAYLNPAALVFFGGASAEELLGQPVLERFHADSRPRVRERICQFNAAPRGEEVCLRLDGTPVPAEVEAVPFEHQGRHGALVFVRDLTQRKRLEQERETMEAQMRHQQKLESIGTLAGGVAHEINNPINGIMNYAQLIQDRLPAQSPLAEYTNEILRETERVATIVRNLLTFARNEKQSHSPAHIADIIEGTLSLIRTIIRQDQIALTVNVPADLPEIICRSRQIQQVLMNLTTNARDALNERYPGYDKNKILQLSAHRFERETRSWIRVTVEDHGTGITPEVRARMFDPFFTTKRRDQGTGLGLSISHGIVMEHQGELSVETEPGQFTRMHLDLPVNHGREG